MKGFRKLIVLALVVWGVYWLFSEGAVNILKYFFPDSYSAEIKEACREYSLDEYFVRSVIKAESGYNENASSGVAHGLMQLTDETAEWISKKTGLPYEKRYEPETNIKMGCYYLSYLSDRFTDRKTVLSAYNAGPANVTKWLSDKRYSKNGKTLDEIPFAETKEYVKKVEKYLEVYKELYN